MKAFLKKFLVIILCGLGNLANAQCLDTVSVGTMNTFFRARWPFMNSACVFSCGPDSLKTSKYSVGDTVYWVPSQNFNVLSDTVLTKGMFLLKEVSPNVFTDTVKMGYNYRAENCAPNVVLSVVFKLPDTLAGINDTMRYRLQIKYGSQQLTVPNNLKIYGLPKIIQSSFKKADCVDSLSFSVIKSQLHLTIFFDGIKKDTSTYNLTSADSVLVFVRASNGAGTRFDTATIWFRNPHIPSGTVFKTQLAFPSQTLARWFYSPAQRNVIGSSGNYTTLFPLPPAPAIITTPGSYQVYTIQCAPDTTKATMKVYAAPDDVIHYQGLPLSNGATVKACKDDTMYLSADHQRADEYWNDSIFWYKSPDTTNYVHTGDTFACTTAGTYFIKSFNGAGYWTLLKSCVAYFATDPSSTISVDSLVKNDEPYTYNFTSSANTSLVDVTWFDENSNVLGAGKKLTSTLSKGQHTIKVIVKDKIATQCVDSAFITVRSRDQDPWIMDNLVNVWDAVDTGAEPNPADNIWNSPDIWTNASITGTTHENPDFIDGPDADTLPDSVYVHFNVRNRGTDTTAGGRIYLYWTKLAMGERWPVDWVTSKTNNSFINCNNDTVPLGGNIDTTGESIPSIAPGQQWHGTVKWLPPNPKWYCGISGYDSTKTDVCLLARIQTKWKDSFGMARQEVQNIKINVKNNNNIATKNLIVTNTTGFSGGRIVWGLLRNDGTSGPINVRFKSLTNMVGPMLPINVNMRVHLSRSVANQLPASLLGVWNKLGPYPLDTILIVTNPVPFVLNGISGGGINLVTDYTYTIGIELVFVHPILSEYVITCLTENNATEEAYGGFVINIKEDAAEGLLLERNDNVLKLFDDNYLYDKQDAHLYKCDILDIYMRPIHSDIKYNTLNKYTKKLSPGTYVLRMKHDGDVILMKLIIT